MLSEAQRKLLSKNRALVVHCRDCADEHFVSGLPLPTNEMVRLASRFKCPTDKSHKLIMGPLNTGGGHE